MVGTIFAWQSWGGMAEHVNYEGAVDVADFFHEQLEPKNFHNENGVCYIVLDSFWGNFTEDQLRTDGSMLYHSSYENITQTHVSLSGVVPGIAIIRAILSDGNLATRKLHL